MRKEFGWGLVAITWQGWVYILIFLAVLFSIKFIPDFWFLNSQTRGPLFVGWIILLLADTVHIWVSLKGE